MDNIKLALKGFIIGIGKIIPGVSGAMFAMMFGVYEKSLNIISNLRTELKKNFKFICILGISIGIAIIFGSNIIKNCLDKYYLPTMLLFIGMMASGIKPLFNKVKDEKIRIKNILCALIVVMLLFLMSVLDLVEADRILTKTPITFLILILSGFIDALGTVIPGVCGTALLMILGYYNTVINALSDIFNFNNLSNNLFVLVPFLIGLVLGILLVSKLINYLFRHFKVQTNYSIIGFAVMSIILLFSDVLKRSYSMNEIIIGIILFIVGYVISYLLDKSQK